MRRWNRPDVGIEKHVGYAFQWFALAVATIVIYGVMVCKTTRSKNKEDCFGDGGIRGPADCLLSGLFRVAAAKGAVGNMAN